jgi:hypothetical protein
MKTLMKKYGNIIEEVSDERENKDGIWLYLKKDYADFYFDPFHPTRQIHEQTEKQLLERFAHGIRKVTESDLLKFPHLKK